MDVVQNWVGTVAGVVGAAAAVVAIFWSRGARRQADGARSEAQNANDRAMQVSSEEADREEADQERAAEGSDSSYAKHVPPGPVWQVTHIGGEDWRLENIGGRSVYEVEVAGYTETDQQRLTVHWAPGGDRSVAAKSFVPLQFTNRLALSGSGQIVVRWRELPTAKLLRQKRLPVRPPR